jgi:hypothetical protein
VTAPLTPPIDLITTAVLTLLRTTERVVFDGGYAPVPELVAQNAGYAANPVRPTYPYAILYSLAGGDTDPMPDLDDRRDTVTLAYQVTSVSSLRNQCQQTGRVLRDRLVGKTPGGHYAHELVMPDGWVCIARRPDYVTPGIDRTGDTPTAIYTEPARYLLTITPA